MCPASGFHWILSPQVKFVLFPWYSCFSCLCLTTISISVSALLSFLCLSAQTHTLSHAYTDTLSLGYYQDKSIWSIQGSGCHFIHIFSSLVTLLKATASIYPEWMNAPTDETQEKMRPTQPEMTTANQPVISKHVLKFCVLYAIENSLVILRLLAQCFLFICEWRDRELACPPSNDKRIAVETSSLGEKMRCYSQWRHRAAKVGDKTKMCLFMPTGVLTLLRAAIAFCQDRELKGRTQDMKTSTSFRLPLYSISPSFPSFRSAVIPNRCWKREVPSEAQLEKQLLSL